jgi:peptidoglycan/LPS O-acetylase OafA/YrhL
MSKPAAAMKEAGRMPELDSVRGIAAMLVVLGHLSTIWMHEEGRLYPTISYALHQCLLGGNEAVILFFVLSGFVLALPAVDGRPQSYPVFAVRRIFRIYVPYIVALVGSVFGEYFLHGTVTQSVWFHQFWNEPVDWKVVLQHILFLGRYDTNQFDPPILSLVHEMRVSLIFPFLCAVTLKLKNLRGLALAAFMTCMTLGIEAAFPPRLEPSYTQTILIAGFFILEQF